jgi:hypothetical protein
MVVNGSRVRGWPCAVRPSRVVVGVLLAAAADFHR